MRGVNSWPIVEAEVLSYERIDNGEDSHYEVRFKFIYNGQTQQDKFRPGGFGPLFACGDKIAIQHSPGDPDKTIYPEAWTDGERFSFAAITIATIFLAHWLYTGSPWFQSSGND